MYAYVWWIPLVVNSYLLVNWVRYHNVFEPDINWSDEYMVLTDWRR